MHETYNNKNIESLDSHSKFGFCLHTSIQVQIKVNKWILIRNSHINL